MGPDGRGGAVRGMPILYGGSMNSTRITEIKSELAKLQAKYEKKMNQPDGARPPAIKADALRQIAKQMDKLDAELAALLA